MRSHAERGNEVAGNVVHDLTSYWPVLVAFVSLVAAGIGAPIPEELPVIGAGVWVGTNPDDLGPERWLILPVCIVGVVISFASGTLTSRSTHIPNSLNEVFDGVVHQGGPAIIMAGLLVLIATPVARVALSVVIFIVVRDRLYAAITATVFVILLISFAVGAM